MALSPRDTGRDALLPSPNAPGGDLTNVTGSMMSETRQRQSRVMLARLLYCLGAASGYLGEPAACTRSGALPLLVQRSGSLRLHCGRRHAETARLARPQLLPLPAQQLDYPLAPMRQPVSDVPPVQGANCPVLQALSCMVRRRVRT
mmetsp:Transcript_39307/g.101864  ORF Transcript_39307/g.101864 Transcript_39307/m.101864 type:complete len:146 (+) Transcript_39307:1695-2132(+)